MSAKKRVRQNLKHRARNRARKDGIRDHTKAFHLALAKGDMQAAVKELNLTVATLDRVAVKGTIHKNTASRKRSRLTRKLN
ncbi:MAG TPA: 30S ribosomal protein S20, partial [Tepidisphaeraceae bacterium]|nr:30S ribosomal protein S20 [Tepidisphaeraceae bacterium]